MLRFLALLSSAVIVGGCGGDAPLPRSEAVRPLTSTEREIVRDRGEEAASLLQQTLAPRLMEALGEGGPARAAEMCAAAATSLTDTVARLADLDVKRTTWRFRNPANAPDYWEQEALRYFEAEREAGGTVPDGWIQVVSESEARFYRPLVVGDLCLHCHGGPEDLAPGVAAFLARAYPEDRAVGYRKGELRGLIRVSVPR